MPLFRPDRLNTRTRIPGGMNNASFLPSYTRGSWTGLDCYLYGLRLSPSGSASVCRGRKDVHVHRWIEPVPCDQGTRSFPPPRPCGAPTPAGGGKGPHPGVLLRLGAARRGRASAEADRVSSLPRVRGVQDRDPPVAA